MLSFNLSISVAYGHTPQVKAIITNSSAGIIIGKAASFLREIREATGGFVKVFPKSDNPLIQERVATIIGPSPEALLSAVELVLQKVAADRNNAMFPHTTYLDVTGGGGGGGPPRRGGGYQQQDYGPPHGGAGGRDDPMGAGGGPLPSLMGGNADHQRLNPSMRGPEGAMGPSYMSGPVVFDVAPDLQQRMAAMGGAAQQQSTVPAQACSVPNIVGDDAVSGFLQNLHATLRATGYNDVAIAEVSLSLQTLAKHNLLGLGLGGGVASLMRSFAGTGGSGGSHHSGAMDHQLGQFGGPGFGGPGGGGLTGGVSLERSPMSSSGPYRRSGGPAGGGGIENGRGFEDQYGGGSSGTGGGPPNRGSYQPAGGDGRPQSHQRSYDYGHGSSSRAGGAGETGGSGSDGGGGNTEATVPIPDKYVGAIIGKDAKTLHELKMLTGAHISVSSKGTYVQGTTDRIVNIRGPGDSVELARRLVERRIADQVAGDTSGSGRH